ncbi:MAG: hypothetical protein GX973_01795, partial [Firmicutes bacterium]|nr:hypothetical protein [Bacillota bacterium]
MKGSGAVKNRKPVLLIISSGALFLAALPLAYWCLGLINGTAVKNDYAGAGC